MIFGDANLVSTQLIESPSIAKITFTGSIPIGKRLAAAAGAVMKPVTMELGGHAPAIVCGEVDPEATAELLPHAKFMNTGQICLCPSRFFVEASIADRFAACFAELARVWKVGDAMDPEIQMGPLANDRRVEAIDRLVENARQRGATILAGGHKVGNQGYFYAPTDVPADAAILHEEPSPILPFTDEAAMLAEANGLEFGLSSYVFTHDGERQRRLIDALHYGIVGVNGGLTHQPEAPLGGWKESPWHLEWAAVPESFALTSGALRQAAFMLGGLEVHPEQMRRNLDVSRGLIVAEAVMMALAPITGRQAAHDLVYAGCRRAVEANQLLFDALALMPEVALPLGLERLRELTDPKNYLGSAVAMVD